MQQLRTGLVGAGLIGQAAHAFYLWEERERFAFAVVADPSPAASAAVAERYGVPERRASIDDLRGLELDAIVCAVPDALHEPVVATALDAGINVLCEKPLALSVAACDRAIAAERRSGRVLQVAYMKRYDPVFERLVELLPDDVAEVRLISVEVNDPDAVPFVAHLPMHVARDVPHDVIAAGRAARAAAVLEAAGRELDPIEDRALTGGFLSSLIHDVAFVDGVLRRLGAELPEEADSGALWDDGRAVSFGCGIAGGARVAMSHVNLPDVADYRERISIYCRDRILDVVFPSPYLRHAATRLTVRRSSGIGLETTTYHTSYEEAFRNELRAFHAAVAESAPVQTPASEARRHVALLVDAHRRACAARSSRA